MGGRGIEDDPDIRAALMGLAGISGDARRWNIDALGVVEERVAAHAIAARSAQPHCRRHRWGPPKRPGSAFGTGR